MSRGSLQAPQRVEAVLFQGRVDAVRSTQPHVARAVPLVALAIGRHVHLVGVVELRLAVLQRPLARVRTVPGPQLGERLHRRRAAQ